MIGSLHGFLRAKRPPELLLDVGGVGYELEAPMTTFYDLPEVGAAVTLATHLVVREDAQRLYGFASRRDRDVFRHLIKVNGIGPRIALAILSSLPIDDLLAAVRTEDARPLTRVPGIGQKTADRLLVDMRGRLDDLDADADIPAEPLTPANADALSDGRHGVVQEAVSALVALGYKPNEASRVIRAIDTDARSTEDVIRDALKALGTK